MTGAPPTLPAQPFGIQAINAMFREARSYLAHSASAIHAMHRSLTAADAEAAGKHANAYYEAMQRHPLALGSLERLYEAARVPAFHTHVDPSKCLKAHESFGALSEAMHAVFWACPGEFWDSPEGVAVAQRFDRAMAEARQAHDELVRIVHDAEDARRKAV